MPTLIMISARGDRAEFKLLKHRTTLGRAAQNDIVIPSSSASRAHAAVVVDPAFVSIEDLGSSNGTFVNGDRVHRQVLAHGDTVRLGTFEMLFQIRDQEFTQVDVGRLPTVPGLLVELEPDSPTIRDPGLSRRGKL
jgi:pSer/pThr/pTyr-binding forkhead associated (FHA) protein